MSFDPDWDSNDLFRQLCAERALADDLAAVLDSIRLPTEVERVLARHRQARGR
jgi:hypothetical protein